MTDLSPAFLADIIAHPDDDAPRLIFADWLEENGQEERAAEIRMMMHLPRQLLQEVRPYAHLTWSRGFIAEVKCKADDWHEHGPALAAEHPLERVELTDFQPTRVPCLWLDPPRDYYWSWHVGRVWQRHSLSICRQWLRQLDGHATYPSLADALTAMSSVLITWAKLQRSNSSR